jgi:hypothetical protein
MTDRELLELAAKAAGIKLHWPESNFPDCVQPNIWGVAGTWNPLEDDGDALRLAVKLCLPIRWSRINDARLPVVSCRMVYEDVHEEDRWQWEFIDSDPYAATRRAIVRAAAEIGRAKP